MAGGPQLLWLCTSLSKNRPKEARWYRGVAEAETPDRALSLEKLSGLQGVQALLPQGLYVSVAPLQGDSESLSQARLSAT